MKKKRLIRFGIKVFFYKLPKIVIDGNVLQWLENQTDSSGLMANHRPIEHWCRGNPRLYSVTFTNSYLH